MKSNNIYKFIKVNILLIIVLIMNIAIGNAYAQSTCNIDLAISETKVKKNDEIVVDVNISNIQSEKGIIALSAAIDYDKNSLFMEKIEGTEKWETPIVGSSYNQDNGKIAITRNGFAKEDETIIKITFRVTKESKRDLTVKLKDIMLSDGEQIVNIDDISKEINVKNGKRNKQNNLKNVIIILVVIVAILILIKYLSKKKKK